MKIIGIERLIAVFCMALALVYAGGSTSQLINAIQHSAVQSSAHEHSGLSDALAMQASHHADVDPADPADDQAQDNLAGGHHHDGDAGPSLLAASAHELSGVLLFGNLRTPVGYRHIVGIAVPSPERPPMMVALAA